MHQTPKRARTAESGACTHCVRRRERCYIGVKGVPCTACHRLNLRCDGRTAVDGLSRTHIRKRTPSLTYCTEQSFASQLRDSEREQSARSLGPSLVSSTDPLENYILIVDQFLGNTCSTRYGTFMRDSTFDFGENSPERLSTTENARIRTNDGAPGLPSQGFRTALLESYSIWIHPQVPVLDLDLFLAANTGDHKNTFADLLLYHAVLFAGAGCVDMSHIFLEGYASRRAARESLFEQAKVLLDADPGDGPLARIQALLLLVHGHDPRHSGNDLYRLTRTCLSLAESIGLHRNPSTEMPPRQQRAWRRTSWSLYNHTRLTFQDELTLLPSQEIEMVTLDDFPVAMISAEARAAVGNDRDILGTLDQQTAHAHVFREMTKLSRLAPFSHILAGVERTISSLTMTRPRTRGHLHQSTSDDLSKATRLEEIEDWHENFPPEAKHTFPSPLAPTSAEKSMYLHKAWLRLVYLGTACARLQEEISNPLIFPRSKETTGMWQEYCAQVADVFEEIHTLDLARFLPHAAVAPLVLALTHHYHHHHDPVLVGVGEGMTDTQSSKESQLKFRRCWNVLCQLRDVSTLASDMTTLLDPAANRDSEEHWRRLREFFLVSRV